jgi:hypothetical protein
MAAGKTAVLLKASEIQVETLIGTCPEVIIVNIVNHWMAEKYWPG